MNSTTHHPKIVQAESISSEDVNRLDSWKEIAGYFRRSVRTVQRWERSEGMPVYRHSHRAGDSVFASSHELEAWQKGRIQQRRADSCGSPFQPTVSRSLLAENHAALRALCEKILRQLGESSALVRPTSVLDRTFSETATAKALVVADASEIGGDKVAGNCMHTCAFLPKVQ